MVDLKAALNKAYLKISPDQAAVDEFKANLGRLMAQVNESESEEFHKNLVSDFLKESYYKQNYFINTKGRNDLVIHHGKDAKSAVGVIIEAKKPTNKGEMVQQGRLNVKALQELVLYFLQERIAANNLEIRHLVVTNVYEWFIFDGNLFETLFAQDKVLVRQFQDFTEGRLSGKKTEFFYKEIAEPAISRVIDQIKFVHCDLRNWESLDVVDLYKIFSPQHLLKLPFVNDSNSLNKPFYNELLHIIGLTEVKDKGKKLIGRVQEGARQDGSLIENAMARLDSLGKMQRLSHGEEFGSTDEERLFNVALRLAINWINRILFLKLLEAQLIKYHQDHQGEPNFAREFAFLNLAKVKNYDDLNSLFFEVLAREQSKRGEDVREVFAHVPYLNSSLFEPSEMEQETIFISNLKDQDLQIFGATVLKDSHGNKRGGKLNALAYLFEFLDAYKFDRDGLEDTQEDSEKLINASVLGLIFEKINGYKDGSFYTPGFITMYMCRETIRRAVVQKFNDVMGWSCGSIQDLKDDLSRYIRESNRVMRRNEANSIINSLKICDPAVGSGHFLVSALNEMIAIKHYLGILQDKNGESLSQYEIEVVNDKLKVSLDGKLFGYNPKNKESQRVQETLFHEKQSIIEGCLFGVDINPNSVMICRLRLWIELLKNAYYRTPPSPPLQREGDLETLQNIDINIKCGNSLISRFGLDSLIVSGKSKEKIEEYRQAVREYYHAKSKEREWQIERLIQEIKNSFRTTLTGQDPKKVKLRGLEGDLYQLENQVLLFEESAKEKKAREKKITKLNNEIDKLRAEIADIDSGKIYSNALEWRFEFPEVLNDQGDFVGFDVIIGNPPYIRQEEIKELKPNLQQNYQCYTGVADLFVYFYELGLNLLRSKGHLIYISSNKYFRAGYGESWRNDRSKLHL